MKKAVHCGVKTSALVKVQPALYCAYLLLSTTRPPIKDIKKGLVDPRFSLCSPQAEYSGKMHKTSYVSHSTPLGFFPSQKRFQRAVLFSATPSIVPHTSGAARVYGGAASQLQTPQTPQKSHSKSAPLEVHSSSIEPFTLQKCHDLFHKHQQLLIVYSFCLY